MATENERDQVRRSIGDNLKNNVEQLIADGETVIFDLKYHNIEITSVTQDGVVVPGWTAYAEAGKLQLAIAPAEEVTTIVIYNYSAFTTEYLDRMILEFGVNGAIVECLKELLASASRRSDYTQGQTKVMASQVFDQLKSMLELYTNGGKLNSEATNGLTFGRRRPDVQVQDNPRIDLSRSDTFDTTDYSDNNVG